MYLGLLLVSKNILPIYSAIKPIDSNCIPPKKYIGSTVDAHPLIVTDLNICK